MPLGLVLIMILFSFGPLIYIIESIKLDRESEEFRKEIEQICRRNS